MPPSICDHLLLFVLHPDDKFPLVTPSSQGPEGELCLLQAVDLLTHLNTPIILTSKQQKIYRINLPIRDKFSEIIQHSPVQPSSPPVLGNVASYLRLVPD